MPRSSSAVGFEAISAGGEGVVVVAGALATASVGAAGGVEASSADFFDPYPQSENALLEDAGPRARAAVETFALKPDVTAIPPVIPFRDVPNCLEFPITDRRVREEAFALVLALLVGQT